MSQQPDLDFLIFGAGWLYQFLSPLLTSRKLSFRGTTTDGRNDTLKFVFPATPETSDSPPNSPKGNDKDLYARLPRAKTLLITFPVKGRGAISRLVQGYESTHPSNATQYILLGSTGVYAAPTPPAPGAAINNKPDSNPAENQAPPFQWFDNESECTAKSERWEAEETLLYEHHGCVLNLAGLYGEPTRDAKIWERAVPTTKEGLRGKKSVHFIHGMDVAKVVVRVAEKGRFTSDRWVVSDGRVYDWWEVVWDAAPQLQARLDKDVAGQGRRREGELTFRKWILELMHEEGVRALPRPVEMLGRGLDSRSLWRSLGITPVEEKFQWPEEKSP